MKKILYITTVSRTINAFLVPHIQMLKQQGYIVDCACSVDKPIDKSLIKDGVNIYDIPFSRNPLHPGNTKAFKKLVELQKENNYDIVHVHTPVASVYGRLLKIKFPKLKTIYTVHGFHFHKGAPILNWLIYYPVEKIMAKFTDTIITMNSEDYERAKTFNVKETYKVNGVGVDLDKYSLENFDRSEIRAKLNLKDDDFVILMIAEVNKNKNHKQMIEAIKLLRERNINVKVICAGDGTLLDSIKNDISKRNLDDSIKMLGFRDDVNKLIIACDIGMLLSYREGLPRNIMEFMACGKPIIGTDIRGIKDLISNDDIGKLVSVGDYIETARYIEYYYNNRITINRKYVIPYEVESVVTDLRNILVNN